MDDLITHPPPIPLVWGDAVLDLADLCAAWPQPVFLVGGAVRDALMRRPTHDIDLLVPGGGIALARHIANTYKGDVYVLDAARDIARALITTPHGPFAVDVSGFRGPDLVVDLTERDFTVNAIAVPVAALDQVIDPLGGVDDLRAKRLRLCSRGSIAHDPLRSLRAVRLSVQLGFMLDPAAVGPVRAAAAHLHTLSAERVRDEFFRLLALDRAPAALRTLAVLGLLAPIMPAAAEQPPERWAATLTTIERVIGIWETIGPNRTDSTAAQFALGMIVMALDRYRPAMRTHITQTWPNDRAHRALWAFAVLAGNDASAGQRLKLSTDEVALIAGVARWAEPALTLEPDPLALHRFWRAAGKTGVDAVLVGLGLYLARAGLMLEQDAWVALLERARAALAAWYDAHDRIVEPPRLLNGRAVQRVLGIGPGETVGRLLDALREAQVTGTVTTVAEAEAFARTWYAAHPPPDALP
jgi:hypothetical protein